MVVSAGPAIVSPAGPFPAPTSSPAKPLYSPQVARICEWLTEKVDSLCAQLKPDVLEGPGVNGSSSGGSGSGSSAPEGAAGPEAVGASGSTGSTEGVQQAQPQQAGAVASTGGGNEREEMGDIDLWSLSADGASLEVNPKWLGHLRARLLGDDGGFGCLLAVGGLFAAVEHTI